MRRFLRRIGAYYTKHAVAIDLVLITAGAAAVKRRFEDVHGRLDRLENGGMVPLDDVVSLREFTPVQVGVGRALQALSDAGLIEEDPQSVIDVEVVDEAPPAPPEGVAAAMAPEGAEEASEAP